MDELKLDQDRKVLVETSKEKLEELELLLKSRDNKIHFLEEEHKKEVKRSTVAEQEADSCR